jgi:hypothetical protein
MVGLVSVCETIEQPVFSHKKYHKRSSEKPGEKLSTLSNNLMPDCVFHQ